MNALNFLDYASVFPIVVFCFVSFSYACFYFLFSSFWSNELARIGRKDVVKGLGNNGHGCLGGKNRGRAVPGLCGEMIWECFLLLLAFYFPWNVNLSSSR